MTKNTLSLYETSGNLKSSFDNCDSTSFHCEVVEGVTAAA